MWLIVHLLIYYLPNHQLFTQYVTILSALPHLIQWLPTGVPQHWKVPRDRLGDAADIREKINKICAYVESFFFIKFGKYRYEAWEWVRSPCVIMHSSSGTYSLIISSSRIVSSGRRRQDFWSYLRIIKRTLLWRIKLLWHGSHALSIVSWYRNVICQTVYEVLIKSIV